MESEPVINGDWDPDEGECELRFDETLADDVADIVEFYRVHGPQVPQDAEPLRTQRVAAALAQRLDAIIEDMLDAEECEHGVPADQPCDECEAVAEDEESDAET